MMASYPDDFSDATVRKKYEILGCVSSLMSKSETYRKRPISYLKFWIDSAIELDQVKVFFDDDSRPVGYIVWAYLSPEVVQKLLTGNYILHPSEWNEGPSPWIVDMYMPKGRLQMVKDFLVEDSYTKGSDIFWVRTRHSARKIHKWRA